MQIRRQYYRLIMLITQKKGTKILPGQILLLKRKKIAIHWKNILLTLHWQPQRMVRQDTESPLITMKASHILRK